ncbi:tRNA uridine-5-carboxymethylaminomethyl(34) synthesis GTPase MnmE [Sphingomonas sp. Tas61C01]|uniref:tRNA uridine-5-carboxymethylaminomethyl(34) synthesis GTPase MnmE n=1 Tax=Sphingomonas sp. Tas61C01 TaxID=3458297 RepID=UPI00403EF1C9
MVDTIFAVSSGRPPAAIAVIRVSGPGALAAASTMMARVPTPRQPALRVLRDGDGAVLDRALVLVFPGPASATGEDLVELHCHGGRAVVDAVERTLATIRGLRRAAPGEFTRRALINGRIDLAEAEGLADLLAAETERQRIAALSGAEGRVSAQVRGWLDRLGEIAAEVEAVLDFSDEDDVVQTGGDLGEARQQATALAGEMLRLLDQPPVERLRDGIRLVIGGPPNSGKSTLINLLAEREVAIVSAISGTTRDRIEAPVMQGGLPFVLTDTAGLTESDDAIEAIGVSRAEQSIAAADLLVWLGDEAPGRNAIWAHSRADLPERAIAPAGCDVALSAHRPKSIEALWRIIIERAEALVPAADALALSRHQRAQCLAAAGALGDPSNDGLIFAEQLRLSRQALATILGVDAGEHLLDTLFARFCVGK